MAVVLAILFVVIFLVFITNAKKNTDTTLSFYGKLALQIMFITGFFFVFFIWPIFRQGLIGANF